MNSIKNFVQSIKGSPIVALTTLTTPKTRKGSPVLQILTCQSVQLGADYGKKLLRATGRDAGPRSWGQLSPNRVLVHHKGETYLQYFPLGKPHRQYFADGVEVAPEVAYGYMYAHNNAPEAVKVRVCNLENVVQLRYGQLNLV